MEYLKEIIDLLLHVDLKLQALILQYGVITYAILFLIVFCETGLVVTPFLPGDSLLFAAGAFAAAGAFELPLLMLLLFAAAVLGDMLNYWIGYHLGPRLFFKENGLFLKKSHLEKTHAFYERYGGKTIIIARFVPIVRTFAPFVAGIGRMGYRKFSVYNVTGAALWILSFTVAGYLFGNLPMVKKNFTLVILAIIVLSILPGIIEYIRQRRTATATPERPQG